MTTTRGVIIISMMPNLLLGRSGFSIIDDAILDKSHTLKTASPVWLQKSIVKGLQTEGLNIWAQELHFICLKISVQIAHQRLQYLYLPCTCWTTEIALFCQRSCLSTSQGNRVTYADSQNPHQHVKDDQSVRLFTCRFSCSVTTSLTRILLCWQNNCPHMAPILFLVIKIQSSSPQKRYQSVTHRYQRQFLTMKRF